jgi:hypothetical protein
MGKVKVEFINTCPSCHGHEETIKKIAARHRGEVDVQIYYAGKDFEYLKKYGLITKGTMIINGKKKFEDPSGRIIESAIEEAIRTS